MLLVFGDRGSSWLKKGEKWRFRYATFQRTCGVFNKYVFVAVRKKQQNNPN